MSEQKRKVAINACHGGYEMSWAGYQRLAERKGLVASYFSLSPDTHRKVYGDTPLDPDEVFTHRVVGPTKIDAYPKGDEEGTYADVRDLPRDDADVIAVIEELGDAASSKLSRLRVVEIPADVEWKIEEYDGSEWIAEEHRTWN